MKKYIILATFGFLVVGCSVFVDNRTLQNFVFINPILVFLIGLCCCAFGGYKIWKQYTESPRDKALFLLYSIRDAISANIPRLILAKDSDDFWKLVSINKKKLDILASWTDTEFQEHMNAMWKFGFEEYDLKEIYPDIDIEEDVKGCRIQRRLLPKNVQDVIVRDIIEEDFSEDAEEIFEGIIFDIIYKDDSQNVEEIVSKETNLSKEEKKQDFLQKEEESPYSIQFVPEEEAENNSTTFQDKSENKENISFIKSPEEISEEISEEIKIPEEISSEEMSISVPKNTDEWEVR